MSRATGAPHLDDRHLDDRQRVLAITAALTMVAIVGVGLSLSIPLLSLEMERMGVSGTLIGINTATAGLASIVAVPFVPRIAARFGVRNLILAAIVVCAASLLAFKATFSFAWWFPLRFVYSAALGTLFVLSEFWINAAAPPQRRGLVMGIYATILSLGFVAGPVVLDLAGTGGWPPYLGGALFFAAGALPLALAKGLTPEFEEASPRGLMFFVAAAPAATIAAFIFGAVETGGFSLLPVYGLRIGYEAGSAAFLVSMVALGSVLLQIPVGLLSDKVDRRKLLLAVALVGAGTMALIPPCSGSPLLLSLLLVAWGGIGAALYTVGLAHLGARFTAPADLASANAAFVILYNAGLIVGPPAIGLGMDLADPHGFALAVTLFFLAYVALVGARLATGRST